MGYEEGLTIFCSVYYNSFTCSGFAFEILSQLRLAAKFFNADGVSCLISYLLEKLDTSHYSLDSNSFFFGDCLDSNISTTALSNIFKIKVPAVENDPFLHL